MNTTSDATQTDWKRRQRRKGGANCVRELALRAVRKRAMQAGKPAPRD